MNAKNLPLKFTFLALLVALAVWGLFQGLRWGIDLQGGYSLTYEIRPQPGQTKVDPQVAQQMLAVLKNRVDPQGLLDTDWRIVDGDRIEVRIPAGSAESKEVREQYFLQLEQLSETNLTRSEIRSLTQMSAEDSQQRIDEIAGGDEALATDLRDAIEKTIRVRELEEQFVQAKQDPTTQPSQEFNDKLANATVAQELAIRRVLDHNVRVLRVQDVLEQMPSAARTSGEADPERFKEAWQQLLAEHPSRQGQLERTRELYENWAKVRQPLDDPGDLKRMISKAGMLEFRIAPRLGEEALGLTAERIQSFRRSLQEEGPEGLQRRNERFLWFEVREDQKDSVGGLVTDIGPDGNTYVLLSNEPQFTMLHQPGQRGWNLRNPNITTSQRGTPAVGFDFDTSGARIFHRLTSQNVGRRMAILLDDEVYSAPNIESAISGSGIIDMGRNAKREDLNELIRTFESGALPAMLNPIPIEEKSFGPRLGKVNTEMGIRAGFIGLVAVAAFMLLYYMLAGGIADIALLLNVVLVLGTMSLIRATFTLPGLAGVILTIGMAVDANVLIFERLREEQERGQSIRLAIKNAYERAFSAIFDSNITTLITCVILGWVGSEEVRGFATTLGLGVAFSLFTSLVVTRWIFQALVGSGLLKKRVKMLGLIGTPNFNWMGKRYLFWAISAAVLVVGVTALVREGSEVLGIEFRGGTSTTVQLKFGRMIDGEMPDDEKVRAKFAAAAQQLQKDSEAEVAGYDRLAAAGVVRVEDPDGVNHFLRYFNADDSVSREQFVNGGGEEAFFNALDDDNDATLSRDELADLPAYMFEISTTEGDLDKIRPAVRSAFGEALDVRQAVQFDLVQGEPIAALNMRAAGDGATIIDSSLIRSVPAEYREDLREFQGGVMLAIENVKPAMTPSQIAQRIREMRSMPDYRAQRGTASQVLRLGSSQDGQTATSFAILLRPEVGETGAGDLKAFARSERDLIGEALSREETMSVQNIKPQVAGENAVMAGIAFGLAWLAMIIYLWVRFGSWRWGLAAVVCLVHDALIVLGLVAASTWLAGTAVGNLLAIDSFKIDLTMVAAVLTVIGYSVNDTIVVFDRIRENRGKLATVSPQVINSSINQVLSRTVLTSATTLLVVLTMYIWGGPGLHPFAYALLVGIIFGTYSSIAIAAPILMGFRKALVAKVAPPEPVEAQPIA
jgi:SecD/SecF fusion protein